MNPVPVNDSMQALKPNSAKYASFSMSIIWHERVVELCMQAGGYGKVITHVIIGLKTVKGTKQLKLDPTIYDSLQKEKVMAGDVIYIEANSGRLHILQYQQG